MDDFPKEDQSCSSSERDSGSDSIEDLANALEAASENSYASTAYESLSFHDFQNEDIIISSYENAMSLPMDVVSHPDDIHPWRIGNSVMARFSEDGYFYPGKILDIDTVKKLCLVKYETYDNEELVPFHCLKENENT